ncbi:MAG: UBP-type zinc finger domain-containing protein [Nakamurella sp.]
MAQAEQIDPAAPPSGTGCVECEETGGWWVHLRRCAQCGHIGCCDDSLSRHGTAHFRNTGHDVMQSYEPDEDWFWNFTTEETFEGPQLADPQHHPLDQTVPGPAARVPDDWERQLLAGR